MSLNIQSKRYQWSVTLKVGVIGLGRIGAEWDQTDKLRQKPSTHLGAWSATNDVEVVAVCDINATRSMAVGTQHNIRSYADYLDMLNEHDFDIISVATPPDTHYEIVTTIAKAKKAKLIFCEKPIAPEIAPARRMVDLCRQNQVKLAINHTRRWEPIWQKMASLIRERGTPWGAHGSFTGEMMNVGIHLADLVNWFGLQQHFTSTQDLGLEYLLFEVDVLFQNGRISMTDNGHLLTQYNSGMSFRYDGINELRLDDYWRDTTFTTETPMALACKQLARCVEGGETPLCVGEDGLKAMQRLESWQI